MKCLPYKILDDEKSRIIRLETSALPLPLKKTTLSQPKLT
ncbi:hypothetical protein GFS31_43970 (plasmid) [Leptolyngbya sp. BL0902]|nr:hypothetical protein GFS31_43970 [Leptolyngbya sp. BL0902]